MNAIVKPALLGLLLVPGCGDLLTETPKDFLAPENFYRTVADAEAAVGSIYTPFLETANLNRQLWLALDAASDISRIGPLTPTADTRATGVLSWDPATGPVTNGWASFYTSISRANVAIERIPPIAMTSERRTALVGEAKFLRALSYFYLVRLYGDVPLVTSTEQDGRTIARTPKDEVYRQIVQDAQDAAASLPASWDARNAGRATRGAALTLLADVHLTRKEWDRAASAAKQVIDSGLYRLYPNYLHAFLPAFENGPEHVFSIQADGPVSPAGSRFVATYYPREVGRGLGGGNGAVQPSPAHHASYLPGDYRKDVTYATRWTNTSGRVFNLYPHVFKWRPGQVADIDGGDVNLPIYRYAEVLLLHAEALNEQGRTAEAIQYLDQIRARARGADGSARSQPGSYAGPVTQTAVRDAIFQERSWEMAHEVKRWFDLIRRGEGYFMDQLRMDPEATDLEPTDILWPIPQTELDLNPALVQNPGY